MRRAATMLLGVLLLAGCGGSSSASTADPNGQGPGADGAAPSLPAADAALLESLLSEGVDPVDAQLLSYTKTDVSSDAPGTAKVVERLVSGDVITFTVTVGPGGDGPAGQLSAQSTIRDDGFDVHLDYIVGPDGLTDEEWTSLDGIASVDRRVAGITTDVQGLLAAAEPGFVSVAVDWGIAKAKDKVTDMARDALIEAAVKEIAPGAEASVASYLTAGLALKEGLELGAEMDALLAALDKLEVCARNPTNPLTQGEYARDPSLLPGILSQIEDARSDIKANTFVMDVGVLNVVLAGAGPKWLGAIVGAGTGWSKSTLKALNTELVTNLRNRIPRCTPDCPYAAALSSGGGPVSGGGTGGGSSSSAGGSGGGEVLACVLPQTIVGSVTYTVHDENGVLRYRGDATGLVYRWDPTTEHYRLIDGRLNWTVNATIPDGGCQGGPIHYFGSGTEPLVPDGEPAMHGGPAVVGEGAPDEEADIGVSWASGGVDPTPTTYYVHASVRIHPKDPVHVQDECGPQEDLTSYFGRIKGESTWWALGDGPNPEIRDGKLSGTAVIDADSDWPGTYQWDLQLKP